MNADISENRLRQLREIHGVTQEQLAQYLGVDQSLVEKLESGKKKLDTTLIENICNLFDCSEEYLPEEENTLMPYQTAFASGLVQTEDLESIASVNKIARNIRSMKELLGET